MRFSTARIAWRNLGRNRKRTVLAIGAIALGQFTLMAVGGLFSGSYDMMERLVTGPFLGHVQAHHPEWREEMAMDLFIPDLDAKVEKLRAMPEVELVLPRIYAPGLAARGEESDEPADADMATVVGVDVAAEHMTGGLLEGLPEENLPSGRGVVLGGVIARRLGIGAGDLIAVIGQDVDGFPASELFEVRAVIRGATEVVNRSGIVMDIAQAQDFLFLEDAAHEIIVRGVDIEMSGDLARKVAAFPEFADVEVRDWRTASPEIAAMLDLRGWVDLVYVVIVFAAAAAGIANTMMMSSYERRHEFGMLLALGSRGGRIVSMITIEAVLIGLIGVAIGTVAGGSLVQVLSVTGLDLGVLAGAEGMEASFQGVNFPYLIYPRMEFRHIWLGMGAVVLTAVLASVWPAALSARLEPREALHS